MKSIVFCNVGNRDIVVAGESQADSRAPARLRGKRLNENVKAYQEQISLPIITPALSYLLERHQEGTGTVVLIGTDQPDTHLNNQPDVYGVPFRDKDTIWYAHTAARWLKGQYNTKQVERFKAEQVQVNPSLYDEAMTAYGRLLQPYAETEVETCYVVAVGGTPACNTALLLQAVRLFGERCRTIYVPEGERPYALQIGRQIWEVMQENTAAAFLRRYDFAAADPLLAQRGVPTALQAINSYARLRLDFDFETAQQSLQTAVNRGEGAVREFARLIRGDLDQLLAGDDLALIGELYQNARLCWQNGRYVDFLGRAFRLQEAIMRYLIADLYDGLNTDIKAAAAFVAYIDERSHLQAYMSAQTHEGQPVDYSKLNRIVFLAMIRHVVETGLAGDPQRTLPDERRSQLKTIYGLLKRIEDLGDLRNKTIIAHGYRGVSEAIVQQAYNKNSGADRYDPLDDMAAVCGALGISAPNPFRSVAEFIIGQLQGEPA